MDIQDIKKIWDDVKVELKETIPASSFEPWILPLVPIGFDDNQFTVLTGQAFAIQVIRKTHYKQIIEAFKKVLNKEIEFNIIFDEELSKKFKKEQLKEEKKEEKKIKSKKETAINNLSHMQSSNLNLKYKFENFVVGENNKFAHATAMAVAENPSKKYNPLFIYGGSGLGKTHLMQAIGHHVLFSGKNLKVRYIKTEDYMNELINSIRFSKDRVQMMSKFRQKYRNVDILLIDDIQFIESKTQTMEEIFHTFDSLYNKNKQIVITSDRLPKDIPTLPDRLRTRFEMGLMVDITPPDFETRIAILANLAENIGLKIDFSVFEYIAQNFENNVRELEGAFNKVNAYADIQGCDISLEFAKNVLKCDENSHKIDIEEIAEAAAEFFDVSVKELKSSSRNQKISSARQVAIYIAREMLNMSYVSIADFFNKKHPTILFSYEKIKKEIQTNKDLEKNIIALKKSL